MLAAALAVGAAGLGARAFQVAPSQAVPPATRAGLLVRGGLVVDGSGGPARRADVRVEGDVIVAVGPDLPLEPSERVLDASGLAVAPGFIDSHSHADRGLQAAPDAESQVRQGITTAIVGQDGASDLPIDEFYETIARVRPAINYATTVGHGTVRRLALGADFRRAATPSEIATMAALVDRAMADGALGLSSGLEYDPGAFAEPAELVALGRVVARYGGYYASHVRDEENRAFEAWREGIDVGRQAGVPVVLSHIKLGSKPLWGQAAAGLRILEAARRDGVRVTADWYPYTFWQSSIYVLIPDRDFENRAKWEVGLEEVGGPGNVLVTRYAPDAAWNNRTIEEIARLRGRDAVTTIIEMIRAAGPEIGVIGTSMTEADLETFIAHPLVNVCSDGMLAGRHPRGYGAFPRVLARYVREKRLLSLPEAIAKMTSRSAAQVGLPDRGLIAPGRKADLVVFDPGTIEDRATLERPTDPPVGIRTVVVNGEVVLEAAVMTGARPGKGLRRASWRAP